MTSIDIPQDPSAAYKTGWDDAVRYIEKRLREHRDNYLTPTNKTEQDKYKTFQVSLEIVSQADDYPAAIAWLLDNE